MRTIIRAMAVLESFSKDRPTLALHQVADAIELSKPTTFRLLKSLTELGYLIRLDTQEYCLSMKLLKLAEVVNPTLGIREAASSTLRELAEASGETIALNTVDKLDRVCLDAITSTTGVVSMMRAGDRVPLGLGASSKILLAYMDSADISKAVTRLGKRNYPFFDRSRLKSELIEARKVGYSLSEGEVAEGNASLAAPIFERDGTVKYSISLFCPSFRFEHRKDDFIKMIQLSAQQISLRNGGVCPENTQES